MPKSQHRLNLGFTVFIIMLIITIGQFSPNLALIFTLAIFMGYTLQKSRFCIAASIRDPMITGITELTRAVLLFLGISIIGFAVVYQLGALTNRAIVLNIYPLGYATVVGGIIFGIGMVLAGGCASGVLMRVGEGFVMQMVALIGLLIGAFFGANTYVYWQSLGEVPGVFLPDVFGLLPTLTFELLVVAFLYKLAIWWQNKRIGE